MVRPSATRVIFSASAISMNRSYAAWTVSFTGHEKGGFYGVETTPRRMLSEALSARTPVPGLFLAGQDVMAPGIAGTFWGGMLGAAAVDPRVLRKFS